MIQIHPAQQDNNILHKHKMLHRTTSLGQGNIIQSLECKAQKIKECFPHKDLVTILEMLEVCDFNQETVTKLLAQENEQQNQQNENISPFTQQQLFKPSSYQQQQQTNNNNNGNNNNQQQIQQKIKNRTLRKIVRKPLQQQQQNSEQQNTQTQQQEKQQQVQNIDNSEDSNIDSSQMMSVQEEKNSEEIQQQQKTEQQKAADKKQEQLNKLQEKDFLKEDDMNQISQQILQEMQKCSGDMENIQNILNIGLNYVRNKISENCIDRNKSLYEDNQVLINAFLKLNQRYNGQKTEFQKMKEENDKLKDMGKHIMLRMNGLEQQQFNNFNNNFMGGNGPDIC